VWGSAKKYHIVGSSGMPRGVVSRGSSCSATAPTRRQSWRTRHSKPHQRSFLPWNNPDERSFPTLTGSITSSNHVRPILRQHPPRLITILRRPGLPPLHLSQHNLHLTLRRRMAIRRRKRMERIFAAVRIASHNGAGALLGQVLWP
jgi:hypothetical protein